MKEEVIILKDGTLTNIVDEATRQIVTYKPVSEWYDGSPMTTPKVDGKLYREKDGKFYRKVIDKDGELFLEKDTVAELRAMSAYEVLLLKAGVYKGVTLNGYHQEGDTPTSIEYYLYTGSDIDDGGSVFETRGIKLRHEFKDFIDPLYFGVIPNGETDSTVSFRNSLITSQKMTGGIIKMPVGTVVVNTSEGFEVNEKPFKLRGYSTFNKHYRTTFEPYASRILDISPVESTKPLFNLTGVNNGGFEVSDITISGNRQNRLAFSFFKCGWEMNVNNLSIDNFVGGSIKTDAQYDTRFNNLSITRCGGLINGVPHYAITLTSTNTTDITNAIHFNNLHMEFCRYYINFDRCRHVYFVNGKHEVSRNPDLTMNGVDSDITNPHFLFGSNAWEIEFSSVFFVFRDVSDWLSANSGKTANEMPYAIKSVKTSALRSYNIYKFVGCDFTTPSSLEEGCKLLDCGDYGRFNLLGCNVGNLSKDANSIRLKNSKIAESNLFTPRGFVGGANISIELSELIGVNIETTTSSIEGVGVDIIGANNIISDTKILGFKSKYSTNFATSSKYNSRFDNITLTDANYKTLMGVDTIDYNDIVIDLAKINYKYIRLNLAQSGTVKTILNAFAGEEITFNVDSGTKNYTFTNGGVAGGAIVSPKSQTISAYDNISFIFNGTNFLKKTSRRPYIKTATSYTVTNIDFGTNGVDVITTHTSGTITITLPASINMQGFDIRVINSGGGDVLVRGAGAETIDSMVNFRIKNKGQYSSFTSDGTSIFSVNHNNYLLEEVAVSPSVIDENYLNTTYPLIRYSIGSEVFFKDTKYIYKRISSQYWVKTTSSDI